MPTYILMNVPNSLPFDERPQLFAWTGMKDGLRNLDHGVCSGLISLMYMTFFYQLYFGMKELEGLKNKVDQQSNNDRKTRNLKNKPFKQRLDTGLKGNETSEDAKAAMIEMERFLSGLKEKGILSNYDLLKRQIADWWRVPESREWMQSAGCCSAAGNESETEYRRKQTELIIVNLKKQIDEFLGRENIAQLIRFVTNTAVPRHMRQ
jgi:hypothetical protein